MKPGILLMVRELHHGGSERQLTEVALGMDRVRYQPHIGAFRIEGIRAAELEGVGVPILHVPVRSFKSPQTIAASRTLVRYIQVNNIQLVHTFDMPLTAYAIPVVRAFTAAKALASQRCHLSLAGSYLRRFVLFAERRAHGIVVNCEFLKHHLAEDFGIPPQRIHLCYNGIDLTRFQRKPAPRPASIPADALVIGTVTVLRPEKGLATLLKAFASVRQLVPKAVLVIVGSGPVLHELQSQARDLRISDACLFQPSTEHVDEYLQHIDIFVLPSLNEALSNSLMEAMACGCCCIASRVGGNPELVADGQSGLLFESGNSDDLARALREVVADPWLRARFSKAAVAFIQAGFSRNKSAQCMTSIYDKLLSRS